MYPSHSQAYRLTVYLDEKDTKMRIARLANLQRRGMSTWVAVNVVPIIKRMVEAEESKLRLGPLPAELLDSIPDKRNNYLPHLRERD